MNALVVYFSRTGNTRHVAEALARSLDADLEEIRERHDRRGLVGYLRSGFDAVVERLVPIDRPSRDPAEYDVVVIGTPVWASCVSAPVRAYLARHGERLPQVAFFATEGGRGAPKAFQQMAEIAAARPIATLELAQRDVAPGRSSDRIDAFVRSLRQALATSAKSSPARRASLERDAAAAR